MIRVHNWCDINRDPDPQHAAKNLPWAGKSWWLAADFSLADNRRKVIFYLKFKQVHSTVTCENFLQIPGFLWQVLRHYPAPHLILRICRLILCLLSISTFSLIYGRISDDLCLLIPLNSSQIPGLRQHWLTFVNGSFIIFSKRLIDPLVGQRVHVNQDIMTF